MNSIDLLPRVVKDNYVSCYLFITKNKNNRWRIYYNQTLNHKADFTGDNLEDLANVMIVYLKKNNLINN